MIESSSSSIAGLVLVGFGEAGEAFARGGCWRAPVAVVERKADRKAQALALGLAAGEAASSLGAARMVISLVTADEALAAAEAYAPLLAKGALWCDGNSVAPETKRAAARAVEAAGGRYVDLAILAPVYPAQMKVPLLLSGAAAGEAEALLKAAGFTNTRIVGADVGRASAIKMIRSVMVKGVEALSAEMMMAAQMAGVVDEVLSSLDASEKPRPWAEKAAYNIERMVTHGIRRATEMEESAKTLAGLGVEPVMTRGTVLRQRDMAGKTERLIEGKD